MGSHHEQNIPRVALLGAGALLVATLGLAAWSRPSSAEANAKTNPPADTIASSVDLRFEDRPDGSVAVLAAADSRQVGLVPPAEGGFVRGVMRGLFRTRKLESIPPDAHFRLVRLADGALLIIDPRSGVSVDLRSFGATNYGAFARLLVTEVAG